MDCPLTQLQTQLNLVQAGWYEPDFDSVQPVRAVRIHSSYMEDSEEIRVGFVRRDSSETLRPDLLGCAPDLELVWQSQLWGDVLHVALLVTTWKQDRPHATTALTSLEQLSHYLEQLQKQYVPVEY